MKRTSAGLGATLAILMALTGCSAVPEPAPQEPSVSTPSLAPGDTGTLSRGSLGEGIIPGGVVSDEYGDYRRLTIDLEHPFLVLDPERIDPNASELGLSDEHLLAAYRSAAGFLVEMTLDSDAFDTAVPTDAGWMIRNEHRFGANIMGTVRNSETPKDQVYAGVVLSDVLGAPLPRTGEPRLSAVTVSLKALDAYPDPVLGALNARSTFDVEATTAELPDAFLRTVALERGSFAGEQELVAEHPWLGDDTGGGSVRISGQAPITVDPLGRVSGMGAEFELTLISNAGEELPLSAPGR